MTLLENEHIDIPTSTGGKFRIAVPSDYDEAPEGVDYNKTFNMASKGVPTILMTHDPRAIQAMPNWVQEQRIALMLAGHTHGGQIKGLGWLWVWTMGHIPLKMIQGFYKHKGIDGFTGIGIGNSDADIRTHRPQVDIITLKPKPS